jgi:glycogen(starch) synthase
MRVLYWADLFLPNIGGVETFSARLLPALQKRGWEFVVVTTHSKLDLPDRSQFNGIPVHRYQFEFAVIKRDLAQIADIRQQVDGLVGSFSPQVIHVNFGCPSAALFFHLHTTRSCVAPTVVTVHAMPTVRVRDNSLTLRVLRSADWITTVSKAMLEDVLSLAPEVSGRSCVIANALEAPTVEPAPLRFDEAVLLCVGRVIPAKGFDIAVTAFGMIADRFPRARLVIAGDGMAKEDLECQAIALGIEDRVTFLGWVPYDEVPALINSATMVLVPSRWREPFGLVALESAQMGRPVIAAAVGGLPEVVLDGRTGVLVEKENAAALAAQISTLLEDPVRAERMGAAAREHTLTAFKWDRLVDAYQDLYWRLIDQSRAG